MPSLGGIGFNGNFTNGQKYNYSNSTLKRCGSFHDGSGVNSAIKACGSNADIPPINEFLQLEPLAVEDHKCSHLSEANRALGSSVDSYSGIVPTKFEELRRFKASVVDCSISARRRIKTLNESLLMVSKYMTVVKARRTQKNSGSNNFKMGAHHPLTPDGGSQKSDEKTKNSTVNKRARSSMAEFRSGSNDKGKGIAIDDEEAEVSVRKGESWDKKMRKKRSFGAAFNSPSPNDTQNLRSTINVESLPKLKASRTARAASVMANGASTSCEASEQSSQLNRKRTAAIDSSQRIAKWGDHRPNKISRTRRANVVSPMSVDSPDVTSGAGHHLKGKLDVSSPLASVTEQEECADVVQPKKTKPVGVRRQGRSARSAASPNICLSPEMKAKNSVSKPTKGSKISHVKSLSKPGRPPKKLNDKKTVDSPGLPLKSPLTNSPIESEDDWDELLTAAKEATNYLNSVNTGQFWKDRSNIFGPISTEDLYFLKKKSNPEEEQQDDDPCTSKRMSPDMDPSKEQTKVNHNDRNGKSNPLYQRVLSALIIEDDDYKDVENNQNFLVPSFIFIDGLDLSNSSTVDNEALLMELQILGVAPESVPDLDDKESDSLKREIAEVTKNINQTRDNEIARLHALYEAAQEDANLETGRLEKRAMDKLVEIAYQKHMAPKATKSFKQAAGSFIRKTIVRCEKYEETEDCSFFTPAFLHIQETSLSSQTAAENEKGPAVPLRFSTGKRTERCKPKHAAVKPDRESNSNVKPKTSSQERAANSNGEPPEITVNRDDDVANMSDLGIELDAAPQDLGDWLDVEDLPDNVADMDAPLLGLDIPMDDLSDLGMF